MTVQSSLARKSYTIAGTGPYTIPFYFLADADIIAIRTPADGSDPVTLTLTTDYTLSGAADEDGGTLTLVITGVDGDTLTIINEPTILQLTRYPETGRFPAASHERALDKLTMIAKRVYDLASRSLRLSDGDTATSLELPVSSPGELIGWDVSGNLANTSPTAVGPGSITTTELAASVVTDITNGAAAKVVTDGLGTVATKNTGTASGNVPLVGTKSATEVLPGLVELATTAEAAAGTDTDRAVTAAGVAAAVPAALNATGTAPIYACRAWISMNGTGTPAENASGNIDGITDNGAGNYTVTFTTAMPDADYCYTSNIDIAIATISNANTGVNEVSKLAGSFQFRTNDSAGTATDCEAINIAFFR